MTGHEGYWVNYRVGGNRRKEGKKKEAESVESMVTPTLAFYRFRMLLTNHGSMALSLADHAGKLLNSDRTAHPPVRHSQESVLNDYFDKAFEEILKSNRISHRIIKKTT